MKLIPSMRPAALSAGLAAGAGIVFVDNWAFEGEVSPIVIVGLLLAATAGAAAVWGRSGLVAATVVWASVPLAHVVKHVFGLPDTLHPNTYRSILFLAVFTLVVSMIGAASGLLLRRVASAAAGREPGSRPDIS